MVRAPPRVLPRSLALSGVLGGGRSGPGSPLLGLGLWGRRQGVPGGVPSTVAWGVWGLALLLPRLPVHWVGCRGPRCGRGRAGVGALLCPCGGCALRGGSMCARPSPPGRAGGPPCRVMVGLTFPLAAFSFCFARPPPGWGCTFLVLLFAFFLLFVGFFFVLPFPRPHCFLLSLVSGPGCLGPWRCVFIPLPLLSFFLLCTPVVSCFVWFPAPGVLGLGVVWSPPPVPPLGFVFFSFFFCPRSFVPPPPPPLLFSVLLSSRSSGLRLLSLLLCFPPGCLLLPCGCCPPPPVVSCGFRRCRSVLRFLSSAALLLPACLALVGGSRHQLPPPGARAVPCATCVLLPSFSAFCLPPPLFFPGLLWPPPSSCLFSWSPAARLSVCSRCCGVSRLAVGCLIVVALPPPPPPFVSRGFRRCCSVIRFFSSTALLRSACLALVGCSRRLLHPSIPPPMCAWCLVLSGVVALRCPSPGYFAVPCCRVPCCVSCCGAWPCCVVGCCALCGVCWGVCLCVVLCCWLLLRVVPCPWSCRPAGLLAVWFAILSWPALPCAVLCCVPGFGTAPRCCAFSRPVLCCCVLCCFVSLVWCRCLLCRVLWRRSSRWGPVLCGAVFCGVPPCCVVCAVCVLSWRVGACCSSPLCFVLCVSWGVVLCVPCPLCSVSCCAALCWCACVVLSVWCVLLLAPGAVVRCCVLCGFLWCSVVRCWVCWPSIVCWWRVSVSMSVSGRVAWFPVVGAVCRGVLLPCVVFCGAVLSRGAVVSCSAVVSWCCLCFLCPPVACFAMPCSAVLCCWLSMLFFARWWRLCAVVPLPSLLVCTKHIDYYSVLPRARLCVAGSRRRWHWSRLSPLCC